MKYFYFFEACFFGYLTTVVALRADVSSGCIEKEKALAFLETAESILTKAKDSFPSCKEYVNSKNDDSDCGKKESLAYIEISKKLISDARENFPTCAKPIGQIVQTDEKPRDCSEILSTGQNKSGIYTIWPGRLYGTRKPLKVYCDMDTEYGGWTVIQRRGKYPVQEDFYLHWENYKNGFGNLSQEFWLGNENIRILCEEGCEIRFDLEDAAGKKAHAHYKNFRLARSSYRISITDYTGDAGDAMYFQNNFAFSTKDKGKTEKALQVKGGWWYEDGTFYSNPNGIYKPGSDEKLCIYWWPWKKHENLDGVEIKIRLK